MLKPETRFGDYSRMVDANSFFPGIIRHSLSPYSLHNSKYKIMGLLEDVQIDLEIWLRDGLFCARQGPQKCMLIKQFVRLAKHSCIRLNLSERTWPTTINPEWRDEQGLRVVAVGEGRMVWRNYKIEKEPNQSEMQRSVLTMLVSSRTECAVLLWNGWGTVFGTVLCDHSKRARFGAVLLDP